MMIGSVVSLHALVPIVFRQYGKPDITIELIVDTASLISYFYQRK